MPPTEFETNKCFPIQFKEGRRVRFDVVLEWRFSGCTAKVLKYCPAISALRTAGQELAPPGSQPCTTVSREHSDWIDSAAGGASPVDMCRLEVQLMEPQ